MYSCVGELKDLIVFGIGDASYKAGEKSIGGSIVLLGSTKTNRVVPLIWKSKLIRQVCHAPKDAETRTMVTVVDVARHTANQVTQMLRGSVKDVERIGVKIFTDSLGTLESIASTKQVERRLLRAAVADLKQKLEENDVICYSWLPDELMIADLLTKEMKDKFGLDDLLKENKLQCIMNQDNYVMASGGEFIMKGRKLREKMKLLKR